MKTHTQVAVIGGGIAGCSTLYHLTEEGIFDCVLIERDELTSGTTWHSAAQVTNFGGTQTMIGLKTLSIRLYKELADDPEYPINYHHASGGLRLATTQDHLDGYQHFVSLAKGMGVDFEVIDAEESARRHPLITSDNLLGALWDPLDGDIDPAQLCQALVRRARNAGAEVYRFNPVEGLTHRPDGTWTVHTKDGDIHAEKIVNAGGYRCNELSRMMGTELPVASMEHQYMLTDPIEAIAALDYRVPLIRCPSADFYSRQEKDGLLIGFYEQDCRTWGLEGIDPNFTMALCPDDLDRVTDVMDGAFHRIPALETVGVHTVVNGPITYTPDGLPLVGRIPGVRNAFCITGLRAGLGEGGGHGWLLAQIIAHGEACYDTWCLDPRRFTRHVTEEVTALKAIEDYQNEFRFHMPHEHRPAARPLKVSPLYDRLSGLGAHYAVVNGWERADFFAPLTNFEERLSFRRNNVHDIVAAEVANVTSNVGIAEVNGFNRIEISGTGVHDWLEGLSCSRVPRSVGKVGLIYLLNHRGDIKAEATVVTQSDGSVWYGSAAASEQHDWDWLTDHLPPDGSIRLRSLTAGWNILLVAGPRARALMAQVAPRQEWSSKAFPWLTAQPVSVGHIEAQAMAVSFSGEVAFELHVPMEQSRAAFDLIWAKGQAEFGLQPFGLRAIESMRLEKGYRHWKADLITEFNPLESALSSFVREDKDFVGKAGLEAQRAAGNRREFVSLAIDTEVAEAHPGTSIVSSDGALLGTITSAAWGHRSGLNLAMGFVDPGAMARDDLCVEVLGQRVPARVLEGQAFDPRNDLVRG